MAGASSNSQELCVSLSAERSWMCPSTRAQTARRAVRYGQPGIVQITGTKDALLLCAPLGSAPPAMIPRPVASSVVIQSPCVATAPLGIGNSVVTPFSQTQARRLLGVVVFVLPTTRPHWSIRGTPAPKLALT